MDISNTIIPKSDQLNSDDLIAGPRTIRITGCTEGSAEQPLSVHYEGENGRPYKPSKSMRRVLVALWGSESQEWVGKSITLFREPTIRFGSDQVGGIRISHASGLSQPMAMALTEKRGKRSQYRVEPLVEQRQQAASVDLQTLCDIGDSKAAEGMQALRAWWESLSKDERTALGTPRINAWKERAA